MTYFFAYMCLAFTVSIVAVAWRAIVTRKHEIAVDDYDIQWANADRRVESAFVEIMIVFVAAMLVFAGCILFIGWGK